MTATASRFTVTEGSFFPLGATLRDGGVNFAIFSENAEAVDLLLFDRPQDPQPSSVIRLQHRTRFVWHGFVHGLGAGQLYAYRAWGPYEPSRGHRFNPRRVLMDPYARAINGTYDRGWREALGYNEQDPESASGFDNVASAPRCMVIDDAFDWEGDRPPVIPMQASIIYEMHVKGLTAHPSSGVQHPGTYLGVIEKIPYLQALGITAVELLPVHHCQSEPNLLERGLSNYWGYSSLGYCAPDLRFSTQSSPGCQVTEFKQMVKALHRAGLEVILDVVYNHTCELDHLGPTFCWRGIDNAVYYHLKPDRRLYEDYSGCGNTLNFDEPQVIKMVMDSLRYWVQVMHVDGFRFDLATALGRNGGSFTRAAGIFTAIHQDPVLSCVKLIAEPWDVGPGSYQVGKFPIDWAEWNGRYRDCVRKFVKGDAGTVQELASRLTGSEDLYGGNGRTPYHSINFVTSHDGFTLRDLVSYYHKHNEANLQDNRDGDDSNNSWSWGVEGDTDDSEINRLRRNLVKMFLATLMVSQGIPMIVGGDEFMRSQRGNNNAYCQDNELTWFDWSQAESNRALVAFVRRLIAFRKRHPQFQRCTFFTALSPQEEMCDINWLNETLQAPAWTDPECRTLALLVRGMETETVLEAARNDILIIINAHWEPHRFRLPRSTRHGEWLGFLNTASAEGHDLAEDTFIVPLADQQYYTVPPRSVSILAREPV